MYNVLVHVWCMKLCNIWYVFEIKNFMNFLVNVTFVFFLLYCAFCFEGYEIIDIKHALSILLIYKEISSVQKYIY